MKTSHWSVFADGFPPLIFFLFLFFRMNVKPEKTWKESRMKRTAYRWRPTGPRCAERGTGGSPWRRGFCLCCWEGGTAAAVKRHWVRSLGGDVAVSAWEGSDKKHHLISILFPVLIAIEKLRSFSAFIYLMHRCGKRGTRVWCCLCLLEGSAREGDGRAVSLGADSERTGGRTRGGIFYLFWLFRFIKFVDIATLIKSMLLMWTSFFFMINFFLYIHKT